MILGKGREGIFHWNSRDHYFFRQLLEESRQVRSYDSGCVGKVASKIRIFPPLRIESIPSFIYFLFLNFLSFSLVLLLFFPSFPISYISSQRKPEEPIKTKESRIPRVSCRGGVKGSSCKEEGEGILMPFCGCNRIEAS